MIFADFQLSLIGRELSVGFVEAEAVVKTIPTFLSLLIFGYIYQSLLLYDTLAGETRCS